VDHRQKMRQAMLCAVWRRPQAAAQHQMRRGPRRANPLQLAIRTKRSAQDKGG